MNLPIELAEPDADVVEATPTPVRTFTFYMDKGGKWRWRCKARNGRTVSVSGESFASKANAERAAVQEASLYGQNAIVLHKAKVGYARREQP